MSEKSPSSRSAVVGIREVESVAAGSFPLSGWTKRLAGAGSVGLIGPILDRTKQIVGTSVTVYQLGACVDDVMQQPNNGPSLLWRTSSYPLVAWSVRAKVEKQLVT